MKILARLFLGIAVLIGVVSYLNGHARQPSNYDMTVRPVVKIKTQNGNGSGVIVHSDMITLILTNDHVASDGPVVVHQNGKKYPAVTIKVDKKKDLALLAVNARLGPVVHMYPIEPLQVFDEVLLVGAGVGNDPYPTKGIVSLVKSYKDQHQMSAPVVGGMSGGAVYKRHGDHYVLVGITRAMALQSGGMFGIPVNNVAYIIPLSWVREFLDEK